MSNECIMVFTDRNVDFLLAHRGTQSWSLNLKRARKCQYVICVANAMSDTSDFQEEHYDHGKGFFVGKNLSFGKSFFGPDSKYIIEFEEYALISEPNLWGASKNPVCYADINRLGFDVNKLNFTRAPERNWPWVKEDANRNNEVYETMHSSEGPNLELSNNGALSFDEAKSGLSLKYGIPIEKIEIIIRA